MPGQTASSISSLVTTSAARISRSCSTSSGLPSSATARPSTRSAQLASSKSALAKCHRRRLRRDEWVPDIEITAPRRSEEHTSELQSLMRISYAVFCLKKKKQQSKKTNKHQD